MITISKSSFIRGMKCPKSLYLHLFEPEERDETSEGQQALFDTGHNVGALAQQLFPGGIDASRGEHGNYDEALAYTRELIKSGQKVIYEAAFSDGETLCYMDILVKKSGKWHAYEVKASTQVKDYQVTDVAFQYYVITRSGLPLQSISLIHINNQYIRRGSLDIQALFIIEPQTAIILPLQVEIPGQLGSLQKMLKSGAMPDIPMGRQCNHPYDCDFIEFCSKSLLEYPASSIEHPEISPPSTNSSPPSSSPYSSWISKRSSPRYQSTTKVAHTSRFLFNFPCMYRDLRTHLQNITNFWGLHRSIQGLCLLKNCWQICAIWAASLSGTRLLNVHG